MEKILAVLTREPAYAERLCTWLNDHRNLLFAAVPFSDIGALLSFRHKQNIRILLLDDEFLRDPSFSEHLEELKNALNGRAPRLLRLSSVPSGVSEASGTEEAVIDRYQSAEDILREIMQRCQDVEFERGFGIRTRTTRVIGIYTPCRNTADMAFSLALAKHVSAKKKCLFLPLGEFTGLSALTGGWAPAGIADAVYYMKQNALSGPRLHSMIESFDGIEYLSPAKNPEDLALSGGDAFRSLISRILRLSDYEVIISCADSYSLAAEALSDICDTLYVPRGTGLLEASRLAEFREHLELTGQESLKRRIVPLELPAFREPAGPEGYAGRLLFGPMGDFVRSLHEGG